MTEGMVEKKETLLTIPTQDLFASQDLELDPRDVFKSDVDDMMIRSEASCVWRAHSHYSSGLKILS